MSACTAGKQQVRVLYNLCQSPECMVSHPCSRDTPRHPPPLTHQITTVEKCHLLLPVLSSHFWLVKNHQVSIQWPDMATDQRFIYLPQSSVRKKETTPNTQFPLLSCIYGIALPCVACDTTKQRESPKHATGKGRKACLS